MNVLITIGDFFGALDSAGIKRARLIERIGHLHIEVSASERDVAYRAVIGHYPVHVRLSFGQLAWWRCWFKKMQIINKMGA